MELVDSAESQLCRFVNNQKIKVVSIISYGIKLEDQEIILFYMEKD
jgi:hypothetical protein